tara:strand:+ start:1050 stop:1829 length:780 start_codon:yes stop_codon:yes gene_type:complete
MSPRWLFFPAPAGGGGFAPTDISGCISWFDADDASTITGTTLVSNWADKSGNTASFPNSTADLSESSSSLQPSINTGSMNGKDTISFNNNQLIGRFPSSGLTTASLFVVLRPAAGEQTWLLFNSGAYNYSDVAQNGSSSTTLNQNFQSYSASYLNFVTGNSVSWSTRTDVYNSFLPTNAAIIESIGCRFDDFVDSSGTKTFTFCRYGGNFKYEGDIAEIVAYDSALSTSDRESVEGYLAHKWGLTASLPSSHPYKTTAP